MTIENILRLVIQRARSTFARGSSNNVIFHTKNIDITENIHSSIDKLKNKVKTNNAIIKDMRIRLENKHKEEVGKLKDPYYCHTYYTVNKFKRNLSGNCQELCLYSFHELMKLHSFEIFNF
ncbi:hypothetical protein [Xenorhabdus innexi]|uniref:Uncharacterized protein n=1 Tax=Xenorhabdus innexi TaxID=290109 RepID=A0A1N6MZ14_9GAMM|nr:hypothetical protein [Xenorhabdus innexi]PHM30190.1 hypothetical protein Xinn_03444 [Xenorhabdus innexi]SIP74052.1 hypothetical protein XIS1_500007 [Xenorhabdus innexi]